MELNGYSRLYDMPPRCLQGLSASSDPDNVLHPLPRKWRLGCTCGATGATLHGYPLGHLNPLYPQNRTLLSPVDYECISCRRRVEILDTDIHGVASEGVRLEGRPGDIGGTAYRGEGPKTPFGCPVCGETQMSNVIAIFHYNDLGLADLLDEYPNIHLENMFSHVNFTGTCSRCGHLCEILDISTS